MVQIVVACDCGIDTERPQATVTSVDDDFPSRS